MAQYEYVYNNNKLENVLKNYKIIVCVRGTERPQRAKSSSYTAENQQTISENEKKSRNKSISSLFEIGRKMETVNVASSGDWQ